MIFQYIPNPKSIKMQQQPDAPEPGNRVQTAVDLLTDPRIPRMRERRDAVTAMFFGSDRWGFLGPRYHNHMLERFFGPQVFGPFPQGRSTLTPPNPNPNPNPNLNNPFDPT